MWGQQGGCEETAVRTGVAEQCCLLQVYNLSVVVYLLLFPQGLSSLSVLTPYLLSCVRVQDCLGHQIRFVFLSISFSRVATLLQHLPVWTVCAVGDKCRGALSANLTPR